MHKPLIMKKILSYFIVFTLLTFVSCEKDSDHDHDHDHHEHELMTTLTIAMTAEGNTSSFTFRDTDGDGGNEPTQDTIKLAANTTYTNAITILNESEDPAEDVTLEIAEEELDHQFFFSSSFTDMTIAYADLDANDNPIGLSSTITTGAVGTGTFTVILRHEPNKTAEGVSGGDIANAGGASDIEVIFNVVVE